VRSRNCLIASDDGVTGFPNKTTPQQQGEFTGGKEFILKVTQKIPVTNISIKQSLINISLLIYQEFRASSQLSSWIFSCCQVERIVGRVCIIIYKESLKMDSHV